MSNHKLQAASLGEIRVENVTKFYGTGPLNPKQLDLRQDLPLLSKWALNCWH